MKEKLIKLKRPFLDLLSALFLTVLFIYLVTCETVRIEGHSMEPTLYHGDFIIAEKTNNVDLGQIVVVDGEMLGDSLNTPSAKTYDIIKRVVALPGDTLTVMENKLYINGQEIDDPFLSGTSQMADFTVKLGADEYFLLGDNRNDSLDSCTFGPISKDVVKGRALFRILLPARWHLPAIY